MFVWLSSFPRSGNTFARMLLHQLFGLATHSIYEGSESGRDDQNETHGLGTLFRFVPQQEMFRWLDQDDYVHFVKTHESAPADRYPSIVVVRDGRDAYVSYTRLLLTYERGLETYSHAAFDDALEQLMMDDGFWGGWSGNVQSWLERDNVAVVHYEELVKAPIDTLQKAAKKLGIDLAPASDGAAMPTFQNLSRRMPQFFRHGKAGAWRSEMSPRMQELFWSRHGSVMERLGYTDRFGPAVDDRLTDPDGQVQASVGAVRRRWSGVVESGSKEHSAASAAGPGLPPAPDDLPEVGIKESFETAALVAMRGLTRLLTQASQDDVSQFAQSRASDTDQQIQELARRVQDLDIVATERANAIDELTRESEVRARLVERLHTDADGLTLQLGALEASVAPKERLIADLKRELDERDGVIAEQAKEIELQAQVNAERQALLKRQSHEIDGLARAAKERLALVEEQARAIDVLTQASAERLALITEQAAALAALQKGSSETAIPNTDGPPRSASAGGHEASG